MLSVCISAALYYIAQYIIRLPVGWSCDCEDLAAHFMTQYPVELLPEISHAYIRAARHWYTPDTHRPEEELAAASVSE